MNYKKIIKSRDVRLRILKIFDFVPDKWMIKLQYRIKTGKKLNLKNPKRYNEKLQWYKLYYRDPLMEKCTDKYLVRDYVKEKGLENILIPLYGVYSKPEEIDFGSLPEEYVLKTTNGGGGNSIIIKRANDVLDESKIKTDMTRWLKEWTVKAGREWNYYNLDKKIVCEKYLKTAHPNGLIDYKFYCFNGRASYVKVVHTDEEKQGLVHGNYDIDFNLLPYIKNDVIKADLPMGKPRNYDYMVKVAEMLSKDFPHVRVDLYNIDGEVFFGELTFFDASGYQVFIPDEFDFILGELFNINLIKQKHVEGEIK